MKEFTELGGFRMAIQLTAVSLYMIACMPYSLAMWSVLGMSHNCHHGHHADLTQMDFFLWRYLKAEVYTVPKNYRTLAGLEINLFDR